MPGVTHRGHRHVCLKVTREGGFIRCRVRHPGLFQKGRFRVLAPRPGVRVIIGRLRGQSKTTIQAIVFRKGRRVAVLHP